MSDAAISADSRSIERWALPTVEGPSIHRRARLNVGELQELERAAWQEAFDQGKEAGLAAARVEIETHRTDLEQQAVRFNSILDLLAQPLKQLDAEIERQLVTLAFTLARQLVRRELKADPAQVIGIVRDTVALLPSAARDVRVHLHPEDAKLLRERLSTTTADRAWTIVEDPVLGRGGCRVTTENSQIDARLETRLGAALSAMLGDERNVEGREQHV
jgi:flagellar assembly protein FliH